MDEWDELLRTFAWMNVKPHEVLEDYKCPFCGNGFMSDEMVACGTLPGDIQGKYTFFAHDKCVNERTEDILERVGFRLCSDLATEME